MIADMVNAAISFLTGSPTTQDETANQRRAEEHARRREDLYARGWRDWIPPGAMFGIPSRATDLPYAHPRVWIWRPEWNKFPVDVEPTKLDPMMNVNGLYWKPWRGDEKDDTFTALLSSPTTAQDTMG